MRATTSTAPARAGASGDQTQHPCNVQEVPLCRCRAHTASATSAWALHQARASPHRPARPEVWHEAETGGTNETAGAGLGGSGGGGSGATAGSCAPTSAAAAHSCRPAPCCATCQPGSTRPQLAAVQRRAATAATQKQPAGVAHGPVVRICCCGLRSCQIAKPAGAWHGSLPAAQFDGCAIPSQPMCRCCRPRGSGSASRRAPARMCWPAGTSRWQRTAARMRRTRCCAAWTGWRCVQLGAAWRGGWRAPVAAPFSSLLSVGAWPQLGLHQGCPRLSKPKQPMQACGGESACWCTCASWLMPASAKPQA